VTIDRGRDDHFRRRPSALPKDEGKVNVYGNERFVGRFRRAISLPEDIDPSKVEATYRDGVLRVSVAPAASPRCPAHHRAMSATRERTERHDGC